MADYLFGLFEVTLACSAVIALLLALRGPLDRRFAPQWRYWAWLAVAVRLSLPFNLSLPQAPVTVAVPQAAVRVEQPIVPAGPPQAVLNTSPAPPAAALAPDVALEDVLQSAGGDTVARIWRIPLEQIGVTLWAVGAVGFLGIQLLSYVNLKRKIRRWSQPAGTYEGIPVWECEMMASPMLLGFLHPAIVVPAGGAGEFALLHEHAHAQRRDLWYKLLLVLANAVHWFNPLVWAMRKAAAADVEIDCDAQVLRGKDEDYRRAYGAALLETVAAARTPGAALTSAFSGNKKSLRARILSLLDTAPRHPGRAALALFCAVALLGGSLVACGPEEPAAATPNAPAIPAGDVYDQESGLYFSAYVGAGLVVPEELRDKIAPRHREKYAGDPAVEFLDWDSEGEAPYFTLESGGTTYPQDDALGKAAADSWFQAGAVQILGGEDVEVQDPVSGAAFRLPGKADGLILLSRQTGVDASWLLCLHREMLGQVTVEECVSGRSGVFLLSVLAGEPKWDFGWKWKWLELSQEAEAQCRGLIGADGDIQAGLELTSSETAYGQDPVYRDGALTFTPLARGADGTLRWMAEQTLPVAEDAALWASEDRQVDDIQAFLEWGYLSSQYINALKLTVADGVITAMAWTMLPELSVGATVYAASPSLEGDTLTFDPVEVDPDTETYYNAAAARISMKLAEAQAAVAEALLLEQQTSERADLFLRLSVERHTITGMELVALNPPPSPEPAEEKTGVIHGVDLETRQITGWWMAGGEIDFDAPFDLGAPPAADIQLLDERGFYRPVELEVLAQRVGLLSSWGLRCTMSVSGARVTSIVEEQRNAVSLQALATESENWSFRAWQSQNPGDGTYSAEWDAMEGISHRLSLVAETETALTLTYTVTRPGDGFAAALVFPDGQVQSLVEGENAVTLPAGRTAVALGGAEGTAGGFTLRYPPADGVTFSG